MDNNSAEEITKEQFADSSQSSQPTAAYLHLPWVQRTMSFVQQALAIAGFAVATILIFSAHAAPFYGNTYWLVIFLPIFAFAVTAIHEGGHFVGARLMRMLVINARIGPIELHALRRGWKWRVCRPQVRPDASGYIFAVPDFSRSIRKQEILFICGGPFANLIAAAVSGAIGVAMIPNPLAPACLAFAVLNGTIGLANLIPNAKNGSDGFLLIQWLYGFSEDNPMFAYARLIWTSRSGITAENLVEKDLAILDQQPMPMPLIRKWFDMKAAQNLANWPEAIQAVEFVENEVGKLDPRVISKLADFLSFIRIEGAFSKSISDLDAKHLHEGMFTKNVEWYSSHLRPRCLALNAAITGDKALSEQLLVASERKAENSHDRALGTSEQRLRQSIRDVVARRVG